MQPKHFGAIRGIKKNKRTIDVQASDVPVCLVCPQAYNMTAKI